MNIWDILGIAPTQNPDDIKKAYFEQLSHHHPEEDPEGFKKLREAYEEALKQKNNRIEAIEYLEPLPIHVTTNDIEFFFQKVDEIYGDFSKRREIQNWQNLLNQDCYFQIDMREELSLKLLSYLMDCFYLPQKVWELFNHHFEWDEQYENLCAQFPSQFIDFVMANIEGHFTLDYAAFKIEDMDYDAFISAYYQALSALENDDVKSTGEWLLKAEKICATHPDLQILKARYYILKNESILALELLNTHIDLYGNHYEGFLYRGLCYFSKQCFLEASQDFSQSLEEHPYRYKILTYLGECLFTLKKYEEAFPIYEKLRNYYVEDNEVLEKWQLILSYLKERYTHPSIQSSKQTSYNLAKVYYYLGDFKEALKLLESLKKENFLPSNDLFLGKTYLALNRLKEAESCLTDPSNKKADTPENLREVAKLYKAKQDYPTSIDYYQKALTLDPSNLSDLLELAETFNAIKDYEKSIYYCKLSYQLFKTSKAYLIEGLAYYHLGQYKESLNCFNTLQDCNTQSLEAYLYLIKNYLALGENELALAVCEDTYKLHTKSDALYYEMGLAYVENNKLHTATNCFEKAYKLNPSHAAAHYELACLYYRKELFDSSLKHALKASELEETNPLYCKLVAYNYNTQKQYEKALTFYNKAISLKDDDEYAYGGRGLAYKELKRVEEAIADFKKALEINSDYEEAHENLGELYCILKIYDEAIIYFTQGAEHSTYPIKNFYGLGIAYFELCDYSSAILNFEKILVLDPHYNKTCYFLALSYDALGNNLQAVEYYTKALEYSHGEKEILHRRGIAYYKLGRLKEADKDLTKVLYQDDKDYSIHINVGLIRKDRGDLESAKMFFKKAIKLNPNHYESYMYLGDVYHLDKNKKKSLAMWEKALSLNCNHPEDIYKRLILLYKMTRKPEKAMFYCDKLIELTPCCTEVLLLKGELCGMLSHYDEALNFLKKAQEYGEVKPDILSFYLGQLLYKQKNYTKALDSLTEAIDTAPFENADYYAARGFAFKKKWRFFRAFKDFRKAVRLDKNNKKALNGLLPYAIILWTFLLLIMYFGLTYPNL